jgi:hypothetical protein
VADEQRHRMRVVSASSEARYEFGMHGKEAQMCEMLDVSGNGKTELVQEVRRNAWYLGGNTKKVR